jgi:cytochrome c
MCGLTARVATALRRVLPAVYVAAPLAFATVAAAAEAVGTPAACGVRGDPARGAELHAARCGGCHSLDEHRVGPAHRGVVGRRAGGASGFDYSPAMRGSELVWTRATLDRWLADPEKTIPGQGMGVSVGAPQDRADLIAYLETLGAPR